MHRKLSGKRALVTAGGQGIGLAITKTLLAEGCTVFAHTFSSEIDMAALEPGMASGAELKVGRADLRRRQEAESLVADATEAMGGLDVLINNAGSLIERRRCEALDEAFWRDSVDLNLSSMVWVTRAALPWLRQPADGASVVNLASLAGRKGGHAGSLAYSTMKGAVLTWTRALAAEVGPDGIRVNAVAPGLILGTSFHATHTSKESAEATIRSLPLGRAGNPNDVARAVVYLASEYDGFITGATLDINGGAYAA